MTAMHVRGVFHNNNERALELIPQEASIGIYNTTYTTTSIPSRWLRKKTENM